MDIFKKLFGNKTKLREEENAPAPGIEQENPSINAKEIKNETPTVNEEEPVIENKSEPETKAVDFSSLPKHEPKLELREYRYPTLNLLDENSMATFDPLREVSMVAP